MDNNSYSLESRVVHGLGWTDDTTKAIIPPIQTSSTYIRDEDNFFRSGRKYSRADNPTYDIAEDVITELERGRGTLLFASGMAAATSLFHALQPGDHVIAPKTMYWTLRNWLLDHAVRWGLAVELLDVHDKNLLAAALRPGRTKLVWVETPANPLLHITDIAASAALAHEAGALLAIDSTAASPVVSQPLTFGADFVMHSATKFLNGHSDVVAGSLTTARDNEVWQRVREVRAQGGAVLGPFEAALLLRGMRTVFLRVRRSCETAQKIAEALCGHGAVQEVLYPGLPQFGGHEVAKRQMNGFGGLLSIRLRDGEVAAIRMAAKVRLWRRATSLGGVESLIEHRASKEGSGTPVPNDLLRLSVGIEPADDLTEDLRQALS